MEWIRTETFRYCQEDPAIAQIEFFNPGQAKLVQWVLEVLSDRQSWHFFSRSKAALELRKTNPYGAAFNEVGELLERAGLKTLFQSQSPNLSTAFSVIPSTKVPVEKTKLLGKEILDYSRFHQVQGWKILPLAVEVKWASQGAFPSATFCEGALHQTESVPLDRAVLALGLPTRQIEQIFLASIWVSALIRSILDSEGNVVSMTWAWAMNDEGELRLASGSSLAPWSWEYAQVWSEKEIEERASNLVL